MSGPDSSADALPLAKEKKINFEKFPLVLKIKERLSRGKNAVMVCFDVDGTLYKSFKDATSGWKKTGNNQEAIQQLEKKSVPFGLATGRPQWDLAAEKEMEGYGVEPADYVIAGAGRLIYIRDENGNLQLDQEYLDYLSERKIKIKNQGEIDFSPQAINAVLGEDLIEYKTKGLTNIKIDNELDAKISYSTLEVTRMSFQDLSDLTNDVKANVHGVKVMMTEDLKKLENGFFSGWILIIPQRGGKDGALNYLGEKIAKATNLDNEDTKKLTIHTVGDAAIDIWMLAKGTSLKDKFQIVGHILANLTSFLRNKLDKVIEALDYPSDESSARKLLNNWRRAKLLNTMLEASEGVKEVVDGIV